MSIKYIGEELKSKGLEGILLLKDTEPIVVITHEVREETFQALANVPFVSDYRTYVDTKAIKIFRKTSGSDTHVNWATSEGELLPWIIMNADFTPLPGLFTPDDVFLRRIALCDNGSLENYKKDRALIIQPFEEPIFDRLLWKKAMRWALRNPLNVRNFDHLKLGRLRPQVSFAEAMSELF